MAAIRRGRTSSSAPPRAWRAHVERTVAEVAAAPPSDDRWLHELAAAPRRVPTMPAVTGAEIARLAEMFARLGPLALALPWRNGAPVKA